MPYLGNTPTSQSFISGTDYFNGTGSQTAFTLTRTVNSVNDIQAVVNNVVQVPNDAYTISGTTITFTSAPSAGTSNVYVRYLSTTTQVIAPSQGTVGTPQLAALTTIPVVGGYTATLPAATGTLMTGSGVGAWTSYTPTITAQTGSFTTVSATGYYQLIGKTCIMSISITITNAGSASGGIYATLPVTSASRVQIGGFGMENNSTGNMLKGYVAASSTQLQITTYSNGSTIGSGYNPVLTVIYETA